MSTSPVTTVTDELLAELEQQSHREPGGAFPVRYSVIAALTAELRRLRAENAELAKDAGRYRWLTDGKRGDYCWNSVLSDDDRTGMGDLDAAIDTAMATQ